MDDSTQRYILFGACAIMAMYFYATHVEALSGIIILLAGLIFPLSHAKEEIKKIAPLFISLFI